MKKFFKFMIKLLAVATAVMAAIYFVRTYLMANDTKEFVDDFDDLDFELDNDLKAPEREYVDITPEKSE
ncbi:hypothetical protein M2145_002163 [Lachnospiraceae bacterium PF1-21]|uniref:Secreted protein n=1 Tax=Ohessyouella blattaphilus TaxID=2949333 RepID=A0ABT1EHT9_9FIRM|nr:hypothetical protein [Ohessyouella blattaphilus]MCP1110076.1 hypothetical protein [Ohessyouella blattaphilus]MCR8563470.1 hypothetical protein [Ohessyouella blattaphilus]MDL2250892.1 hypothetical protein [Lachnospiraceae bacterium OttesenSCG-928-J05]